MECFLCASLMYTDYYLCSSIPDLFGIQIGFSLISLGLNLDLGSKIDRTYPLFMLDYQL